MTVDRLAYIKEDDDLSTLSFHSDDSYEPFFDSPNPTKITLRPDFVP